MNHDEQLARLLRMADDDVAPPAAAPPQLAARVRRLDRQRRTRTRLAAAALLAVSLTAAALTGRAVWPGDGDAPAPTIAEHAPASPANESNSPALSAKELAALEDRLAEIESELRVLRYERAIVERDLRLAAARRTESRLTEFDEVELEVDIVAEGMLGRADRLLANMRPNAEAAAQYRRLIELFPDTHAASAARERLAGLED